MMNWEERGNIRVHTFKYAGVLKSEFYYRLETWPKYPFLVIGIDLTSLNVFFRCQLCLHDSRWGRALKAHPKGASSCKRAALRLYYREVNGIRIDLGFPEKGGD